MIQVGATQGARPGAGRGSGHPRGRVIQITSAVPAEGKSTTALALARTYALAGKRTLLIDGDLRKPSVHLHLGKKPRIGFVDYLRAPTKANSAAGFQDQDALSTLMILLGTGRSALPTDQLLNSVAFEATLRAARESFDIVVIDTPPVLPVVDARYVARQADAVAMVVRYGATEQRDLRRAAQMLAEAMRPNSVLLSVLSHEPAATGRARDDGYGYHDG